MTDPSSLPADSLDQAATRMGGESRTDSPEQRTPGDTFASLGHLDTGTDSRSSLTDLPDSEDGDDADREIIDLASRYELGAVLGRGGMGEVIRATDRRLKRDVAIKRMRAELGASRQAMRRFLTEAISVAALNHFNVVQIFDYGHTADGPFLVMELVEGPTLAELLKDGPLPLEQAVDLLRQLCDGLQTAHLQGIIHRDIKPANILVTASGIPKLTDFGLAKEVDGGGHTVSGAMLGTLDYMAPEQKQDSSLADARSDQWSLAATFYQMLTGDVPRVIEIEAVPEAVREAVRRALKARPAERFDSVREFAEAVQHAADTATRSADSQTQTALKDGQCPDCGTVNDVTRKFCRSCGSSLLGACPACDAETRVWEQFCGECGTDMPAVLAEHVEAARELKGEIQSLQSSFRHAEALEKLIPLRNSQHAALTEYREWADEAWKRLTGELAELEMQRNQLLQTAREQAESGHLSEARRYLARIPGPMQTDETRQLAGELAAAVAELKQLAGEIQYAARARLYDGLEQKLNRYLELKPQDQKALALLQKVRERNLRSQTKATGQGASAGK
ncbi:MAG: protein kinase, partial [Planctomycetaceae bacterium]|nr:protein kinase [Planctomycetaceae bacterium]